jgi:hypothetical protein
MKYIITLCSIATPLEPNIRLMIEEGPQILHILGGCLATVSMDRLRAHQDNLLRVPPSPFGGVDRQQLAPEVLEDIHFSSASPSPEVEAGGE